MATVEQAAAGAASAALSNEQKRNVAMAAEKAWKLHGMPMFDQDVLDSGNPLALTKSQALELWRQEEQVAACGRRHLTCCTQADYPALMGHFARLNQDTRSQEFWQSRAISDPRRQAWAIFQATCHHASDVIERPLEYAGHIARSKFKGVPLADLQAKQLWVLIYDLKRAAAHRRAKTPRMP